MVNRKYVKNLFCSNSKDGFQQYKCSESVSLFVDIEFFDMKQRFIQ